VIFPAVPGPAQARRWLELVGALHGARPAFPGRLEPGGACVMPLASARAAGTAAPGL